MKTLHLISHTHWDREWHQTFQQFRLKLVHLVDGLLEILAKDPNYRHFMLDGQTIVLDDYLQVRPEKENDLRRHIQSGRVLVGPWYILPDEFLVSPEATIRNLLEGERGARRFGAKMMVGYIPDPFGHIGQMPQILRGFGIEDASLWRGVGDQANEFWWAAPDGSRVLMGFLQQGYFNAASITNSSKENFVTEARRLRDQLFEHTRGEDALLLHGVDHQEASPATSAMLAYAEGKLDGDRVAHSTLPDYFYQVRKKLDLNQLPVMSGELRKSKNAPMLPGVLSARMWIKQRNQACETLLEKWAEPFSTWAQVYAAEPEETTQGVLRDPAGVLRDPAGVLRDPTGVLREAWRILMQCHPHDSICGCSIDQVHDEMRSRFDQVEQIGEAVTQESLEALCAMTDTRVKEALGSAEIPSAVVVFNPSPAARGGLVQAELKALPKNGEFELVDEKGEPVPFQTLGVGSGVLYDMRMDRVSFRSAAQMVTPGTGPAGMRIVGMKLTRAGEGIEADEVLAEVLISQTQEPDLEAWEASSREMNAYLDDPAIQTYHIQIKGEPTSQVRIAVRDVPALGYRTLWVREKKSAPPPPATRLNPLARALMPLASRLMSNPGVQSLAQRLAPDPASKPPYVIENEFFRVEALADGSLDVLDKRSGKLHKAQNRFLDGGDRGDTYNYSRPDEDQVLAARLKAARAERGLLEQALVLSLEVPDGLDPKRKARGTKLVKLGLTCRVTLTAGLERIEFHTQVENQARDHRLRVHFATPCQAESAEYDGHFEIVRRPLGVEQADETWAEQPRPEVPQRAFCLVSDGENGLLVANRGLPEVEVLRREDGQSEIALTLLRCVGWLSRGDLPERKGPAGPELETPGAQMPGSWSFDYALIPFAESGRMAAIQQAYAFETPLRAVGTDLHPGRLPEQGSFLRFEPEAFIPSAVKLSEDGTGWVARGYNLTEEAVTAQVKPLLPERGVQRANLAEQRLEGLDSAPQGGYELKLRGHEIASIYFGK